MKLEAGKYYRTRDGRKAYVIGQNVFECNYGKWFAGYIDGDADPLDWSIDGCIFSDKSESHRDLVAEWVEKKKWTFDDRLACIAKNILYQQTIKENK